MGVGRGLKHRLGEHPLVHVIGTTARNQVAPWSQQAQGPQVDFLVPGQGVLDRGLVLGEGRGVQDDGVVAPALPFQMPELVKDVSLAGRHVGDAVGRGVGGDAGHGVGRHIERLHRPAPGRQGQGKSAVVTETVE